MKKIMLFVSLIALAAFIWGCCGGSATSDAELEAALDDRAAELEKELDAELEAAGDSGDAGGGACGQYEACCTAWADSLGAIDGYPQSAIDTQKEACKSIESMKGMPGAEESCQTALDAMKQGAAGMAAYPDWKVPSACE